MDSLAGHGVFRLSALSTRRALAAAPLDSPTDLSLFLPIRSSPLAKKAAFV